MNRQCLIIVMIISIISHQHSIIIINHGNCLQASIIGRTDGCWFPILLHMQCFRHKCNIQSHC